MTVIVGIDPGNNGAFAFLDVENNSIRVVDMPTLEFETTKKRVMIDPYGIVAEMQQYDIAHVYLEEVFSSPQMGVVSSFNFGQGKGVLMGITAALNIPISQVKPAKWKKEMKVPADKRAAVLRASQLFPDAAPVFRGPRGGIYDGRAEAALLAFYGALELGCTPTAAITLQGE